jgi:ribosomal protein S1
VLAPEISWSKYFDINVNFKIGDSLFVKIIRYNYYDNIYVGSIKRLKPELNPFLALSRLEPGHVLHGEVVAVETDSVRIELPNSVRGSLPKRLLNTVPKVADKLDVTISALEADQEIVEFSPA